MLGCLFLMGVALVPINDNVDTCFHDLLAFLFFGSALMAMVVSAIDNTVTGRRGMAVFTVLLLGTFAVSYFTTEFGVYEATGVLALMVWLSAESVRPLGSVREVSPTA